MSPLLYKQQRQLINAVWRTLGSPRQMLALLVVLLYSVLTIAMLAALVVLPFPDELRDLLAWLGITQELDEHIQSLRGALTLTILMISSLAAFQNPLLRFAPADIDILFTTPLPLWNVMIGRIVLNHLRACVAGYFFWGLMLVPVLRLTGYDPWPLGIWGVLGLMLLFSTIDQLFASLQLLLIGYDTASNHTPRSTTTSTTSPTSPPALTTWIGRVALLLIGTVLGLLLLSLVFRLLSGTWFLLDSILQAAGGPLIGVLLFPLSLAADLLLLPMQPEHTLLWTSGVLLLLDVGTVLLLLRQVNRGGAGILLETSLAPVGRPSRLDELLWDVGFHPVRFVAALWHGELDTRWQQERHARATARPILSGQHATTHMWRRVAELWRTPFSNILAVAVLGVIPLVLYDPSQEYDLIRLLTALILSASLGSQLFNDAADHLRYANLELSAPVARWQVLWYAHLPRLLLYWTGGVILLLGAGLLSSDARWDQIIGLIFWYPLVQISLLALRGALVFLYPAAGLPGQRDPVQAMLVTLMNGLLVLFVMTLSILPYGVLVLLIDWIGTDTLLLIFWPTVFGVSAAISAVCCGVLLWAYGRYEPGE